MPSSLSREVNYNCAHDTPSSHEEMNSMCHTLTYANSSRVKFGMSKYCERVFGDNCKRFVGSACNQQAQNQLSATKRKEVGTSNFQPAINLPKNQATQKPVQN